MVAERRQWPSAASKPRRKTRVKLWHLFMDGKGTLAPDLPFLQCLFVVHILSPGQVPLGKGLEVVAGQLPGALLAVLA